MMGDMLKINVNAVLPVSSIMYILAKKGVTMTVIYACSHASMHTLPSLHQVEHWTPNCELSRTRRYQDELIAVVPS